MTPLDEGPTPPQFVHVGRRLTGVLVIDGDGVIHYANEAARHLIAPDEHTLVGREFGLPLGDDMSQIIEIVDQDGLVQTLDMRVARYEGPAFDADVLWAVTLRPGISPQSEDEVAQHLAKIDDALSVTYHELGNAVARISAGLTMLRDMWDSATEQARFERLVRVEHAATLMAQNLRGYLDASRVDNGVFEPRPAEHVLLDLVLEHLPDLGAQSHDVHLDIPVECSVALEAMHLWSIVGNFVNNALRHGSPPVSITARTASGGAETVIRVSDRGSGVPDEFVADLFQRFRRGRATTSSNGLGLWIAATMASAYDGHAWYEPASDGGATFCVRLPARLSTSVEADADATEVGLPPPSATTPTLEGSAGG